MKRSALESLATLYGIETEFYETSGTRRVASDDALLAMLRALGCPAEAEHDLSPAIDARRRDLASRALPPIIVCWGGAGSVRLRLPTADAGGVVLFSLLTEAGEERTWQTRAFATARQLNVGDATYRELSVELPGPIPYGYHRLRVQAGSAQLEAPLWCAPPAGWVAPEGNSWGLFAPTYALKSERNLGVGDYADLRRAAEWVGALQGSVFATLPLLPTFIDGPFDPSPYSPISRRFWNELYLAIDELPELAECAVAQQLLASEQFRATSRALRAAPLVDYFRVSALKRQALTELAAACYANPTSRAELERRLELAPAVADYARFRATMERQGRPFRQWPARMRDGDLQREDYEAIRFQYYCYCQIRAEDQIAGCATAATSSGAKLYMDLPIGGHPDGYDAWRFGQELLTNCSTGAPPDQLFQGGQDWGFAPRHAIRSSELGHPHFRACLRHHMRHSGVLRIDHVMGLHRAYCIPRGLSATQGVYVRQPHDELYAAMCIESHRFKTELVGEDLGTVPDEVRLSMAERRISRLFVLQYEPTPKPGDSIAPPADSVASLNTHDMPTLVGHWRGRDLDTDLELGLITQAQLEQTQAARREDRARVERSLEQEGLLQHPSTETELLVALLKRLARSDARCVLVSIDDLLLEIEPQNEPGTGPEHPNWRRKLTLDLSQLAASTEVQTLLKSLPRATTKPPTAQPDQPQAPTQPGARPASRPAARLSDVDLYLFNQGTHHRLYELLGAHPADDEAEPGTYFAVWAPNARAVHVIGDFNYWGGESRPLWPRGESGIWEGFAPGVRQGDLYKYRITTQQGEVLEKSDPFARRTETPPKTASVVHSARYTWRDAEWMQQRAAHNALDQPWSVYELHLGSWRRAEDGALFGYRELAPLLVAHLQRLQFTHVEFMPVTEHPFYGSWGYQVTSYFASTSRYGTPEDLKFLIDELHQAGIGVVLDWVPGHFPTDGHALGRFDGAALYEHPDPRRGFHPDWKSYIFDFGRPEVRAFLMSSAAFWLEHFHADGLRVDGVASMLYLDYSRNPGEWTPNVHGGRENLEAIEFSKQLNVMLYERFPDTQTFAEESTAWPMVSRPTYLGGLGFGAKWDMGWMHDVLDYFHEDPLYRKYHHDKLTFRAMYAWHENFVLPLSHDEVVHGKGSLLSKMPGDDWQRFANLRLLYAYMYASPGHKLLFMGAELATRSEWDHDAALDFGLLDHPMHAGVAWLLTQLNRIYRAEPALHQLDQSPSGFEWADLHNSEQSVLAFQRVARDGRRVLCVFNFTPVPRGNYRIGVPHAGAWREILNTDATEFGGSGVGNFGQAVAQPTPMHGHPQSIEISLPPLGALFFQAPVA